MKYGFGDNKGNNKIIDNLSSVLKCEWNIYLEVQGEKARWLTAKELELVESINVKQTSSGSDTLTLVIKDPNMDFLNKAIFIDEAKIQFMCRWSTTFSFYRFAGYISAIDVDFPEDGMPSLTITCMDNSHLMNREKKKRSWDNITSAEVVQKIAQEYGFQSEVEDKYDFERKDNIAQSDQTDIEFLESLAGEEREPFLAKYVMEEKNGSVTEKIVYKRKALDGNPTSAFEYKQGKCNIISFSPQINKETKRIKVEKSDIATNSKTVESGVGSNTTTTYSREEGAKPTETTDSATSVKVDDSTNRIYVDKGGG